MQDFQETVPVVFSCSDGDVEVAWVSAMSEKVQVRRFRAHLGHVVEVLEPGGRTVRVGPGLIRTGCLRVHGSLEAAIKGALEAAAGAVPYSEPTIGDSSQHLEPAAATGSDSSSPTAWWRHGWLKLLPKQVTPLLQRAQQHRMHANP